LLRQGEFGPRNFDPALLNNPKPLNNFNHRLAVSQMIYDGGRRERQNSMARIGVAANRQALAGAEQQQLLSVVRDYYRVLLADEALNVARESSRSAEADLEKVRRQNAVGLAVKSDVMRLEVQAADFRRAVMAAESEARISRQELELDLGREPSGRITLADAFLEKALPQVSLETLVKAAAANRPDLKQAEFAVKLAEDRVQSARGGYFPQVGFSGSYDFNNGTSTGLGNQYLLVVRMQFNLFDGGAKSSALQQARAAQQAAAQLHRQLEQRVRQQVQGGYERQRLAQEQYQVAKRAVEAARESLRIIQDRREAGLATITDLLSAQVAWNRSHLSSLYALHSYFVEYAAMEFAAGMLTNESPIFSR
jgi:outer membrane protein TolC